MIEVKKNGIVLQKTDLPFEDESVLNPAAIKDGDLIHLFYRAVHTGNHSSIGYCKIDSKLQVQERLDKPLLVPEADYESHGMEDPRMVNIDGVFYLSYIAFDGVDALGALATSTDLKNFERKGIIVPKITLKNFDRITQNNPELNKRYMPYHLDAANLADKDFVYFPRKINGQFAFMHRIKPDIQLTYYDKQEDLTEQFWNDYFADFEQKILFKPRYAHEASYIGSGCPPIETEQGWLIIYHGVKNTLKGYEYACCAALMDINNPQKELGRLPYPLFKPELDYELSGDVDDVCFPTGTALFDDTLYIYYGAADELIACASVSLEGLLEELLLNKTE